MANQNTLTAATAPTGWAYRFFRGLTGRRDPRPQLADRQGPSSSPRVRVMARQLVTDDRYAFVLLNEAADDIPVAEARAAWDALSAQMAMVPSGSVPVVQPNGTAALAEVPAFYLDRWAVTHRQFQRFVDAGGYDNLEIWPQEVWPSLMKFTDRTRKPGPRDWENGRHHASLAEHPVTGVCWYEAAAYAAWVGKRLPAAAEWQKAGGWPEHLSGGACQRYPWGDVFEPGRANLWASGPGRTAPVTEYAGGATPNGIYQMSGNVWEWLADPLTAIPCHPTEYFHSNRPMRRIVGGAYDTYFSAEATNQFVTGQPELDRRENLGFRCAVAANRLRQRD